VKRAGHRAWNDVFFQWLLGRYERSLTWALRHRRLVLLSLLATVGLNIWLFALVPKTGFPEQDTGRLNGTIQADQSSSFQHLAPKLKQFVDIIQADPAVETVAGATSGGNAGRLYIDLKPLAVRKKSSEEVITRLRPQLARVSGATVYLAPVQYLPSGGGGGGQSANALYQYALQGDDFSELRTWTLKLVEALKTQSILRDVSSDQLDQKGLETDLVVDRNTASRLGLTALQIDNTLYDAFGQRQVSTIYKSLNQYHVIMVDQPQFSQNIDDLKNVYVSTSAGSAGGTQSTNALAGTVSTGSTAAASPATDVVRNASQNAIATTGHSSSSTGSAVSTAREVMIPLSAFARYEIGTTPLAINHQGEFVGSTVYFNLAPGVSYADAVKAVNRQVALLHLPNSIKSGFQDNTISIGNFPLLLLGALVAIYVILGVLYESYAHPFTILSTLPSAGVGAFLALLLLHVDLDLFAILGLFLLIGIVKKNAIMMVDLAIALERSEALSPTETILKASLLRFRPILMTTMAALFGAIPLAIGFGSGAELRRPLGITIAGGLIFSQLLTLYTTPVVYLYVDRTRRWVGRLRSKFSRIQPANAAAPAEI
jgi:multidrug efflux pump